jgi:hypothetical protein
MYKIELSLEEVNFILGVLGKREFDEVAPLIIKIRGQVIPQVQAAAAAAEAEGAVAPEAAGE